jgi:parvulin-like peptidyl-prolyl isomerase
VSYHPPGLPRMLCAALVVSLAMSGLLYAAPDAVVAPRPAPKLSDVLPETVVKVNGVRLTREQLAALAVTLQRKGSMETLISRELVRQKAEAEGVSVTDAEVQIYIELSVARAKKAGLDANDLAIIRKDAEAMRPLIGPRLLIDKLIRKEIKVTDEQVRTAFKRKYGARVTVRQIVLNRQEDADTIRARILAGADFERMARTTSRDPVSAKQGGKMPPLPADCLLGEAVRGLKPGDISKVVKTPDGFHILKLESTLPPGNAKYVDVAEALRKEIVDREVAARRGDWLRDLRRNAKIERAI